MYVHGHWIHHNSVPFNLTKLQITFTATVSMTECTDRLINGTRSVPPAWHSTIDSAALIVAEELSHM